MAGESRLFTMSCCSITKTPPLRLIALLVAVCCTSFAGEREAAAQGLGAYGFQPYGFYQPYGVRYRSSVATPPYFALNPPVYYGTRHLRPYGISPFATPPQVGAPSGYTGQVGSSGVRARTYQGPAGNPFICRAGESESRIVSQSDALAIAETKPKAFRLGEIQINPFVTEETHLAKR
jgi:hypothetical protein